MAGGTDSDQVAPYNPFVSLRWLLDGKVIDGSPMRGPEESPSREEALRMYSLNAAWFTFDEGKRFWIRHAIFGMPPDQAIAAPSPTDPRPVLAGGDSDTDFAMLESASAMRVLFDRGGPRVTCLARREPDTFIVLPQFVDPVAHAPVECP